MISRTESLGRGYLALISPHGHEVGRRLHGEIVIRWPERLDDTGTVLFVADHGRDSHTWHKVPEAVAGFGYYRDDGQLIHSTRLGGYTGAQQGDDVLITDLTPESVYRRALEMQQ